MSQITASRAAVDDKTGMLRHAAIVASIEALAAGLWQPAASYTHKDWQEFQKGIEAFQLRAYERAYQMWLPLAEAGIPQAQYNLGVIYTKGNGVRRDYVEAYKWFAIALAAGNIDAAAALVTITARMTKDQIAEAERRATEWQVLHPRAF